jgi:predicted phosphodiesterase
MTSVLVIPDTHIEGVADAQVPNRVLWLIDIVKQVKPSHVVCLGDWLDLPELARQESPEARAASKERLYKSLRASSRSLTELREMCGDAWPREQSYFLWGNHEARVARFYAQHPFASPDEDPYNWLATEAGISSAFKYVQHEARLDIGASKWIFRHYFPGKGTHRAIGGKHQAHRLLDTYPGANLCVGHSHHFSVATRRTALGELNTAVVAGCLLDRYPDYLDGTQPDWWMGVVLLTPTGTAGVQYDRTTYSPSIPMASSR